MLISLYQGLSRHEFSSHSSQLQAANQPTRPSVPQFCICYFSSRWTVHWSINPEYLCISMELAGLKKQWLQCPSPKCWNLCTQKRGRYVAMQAFLTTSVLIILANLLSTILLHTIFANYIHHPPLIKILLAPEAATVDVWSLWSRRQHDFAIDQSNVRRSVWVDKKF